MAQPPLDTDALAASLEMPVDLLPDVQVRLDHLTRKLDLFERRLSRRETGLQGLKPQVLPVSAAAEQAAAEHDRLSDIGLRIERLERRGFGRKQGELSLDFARFSTTDVLPGVSVVLSVQAEGFEEGDVITFEVTEIVMGLSLEAIRVTVLDRAAGAVTAPFLAPPAVPEAGAVYRFTASGRGLTASSPVLTVRGAPDRKGT
ncbi:MAG: hypothetical protein EXR76_17760 [Myxococcales bacterium]|nr:hypothetical protein [Myxococcales bacterium]